MKTRRLIALAFLSLLTIGAILIGCDNGTLPAGVGRFVFVGNAEGFTVTAFTVDSNTGALTPVAGSPFSSGSSTCCGMFLDVDPTSRFVYVPRRDNTVAVLGVNQSTGALSEVAGSPFDVGSLDSFVAKADPSGRFLYVTDDSGDTLLAFSVSSAGVLTPVSGSPYDTGACPHGIVVDPQTRFVYVMNRCDDTISAFTINSSTGALTEMAGSPFPAGNPGGDDNPRFGVTDTNGHFLYVTVKDSNAVSAFAIDQTTGALTILAGSPFVTGPLPLGIAASPTGDLILVCNYDEESGTTVSVFSINTSTGALTEAPGSPIDLGSNNPPHTAAFDPSGRFVYVVTPINGADDGGQILAFAVGANGALTPLSSSPFGPTGQFSFATQIVIGR